MALVDSYDARGLLELDSDRDPLGYMQVLRQRANARRTAQQQDAHNQGKFLPMAMRGSPGLAHQWDPLFESFEVLREQNPDKRAGVRAGNLGSLGTDLAGDPRSTFNQLQEFSANPNPYRRPSLEALKIPRY